MKHTHTHTHTHTYAHTVRERPMHTFTPPVDVAKTFMFSFLEYYNYDKCQTVNDVSTL